MKTQWTLHLRIKTLLASAFVTIAFAEPAPPSQPLEIPFQLYRDYIIVAQGSIGENRNRNFLLDTGAVPSVVDARLAKKLKLKGRESRLSLFTSTINAKSVVLPSLELGPIGMTDHPVLVQDLRFIEKEIGVRIDAIIGLDVLGWSNLAIDYPAQKLNFGIQVSDQPGIPLELGPGCMLVTIRIGDRELRLMVDTGASGLMLFESRFRSLFPDLEAKGERKSANMSGTKTLVEVELPGLQIGTTHLGATIAALIPSEVDSMPAFDGLLGLRSLGASQVYFDFANQRMSWVTLGVQKLEVER